ncbi:hypothetical protein [Paenirhodobacter hankyongi]|uniref:Gamma-glutamyl kinase n=1 Tax=Paenirhodobacter hankyongi TaxID=2294033 RepID=A0A421BKH2_9RHOB|nr:hypothetical protein [Sinirhodobacter hankyongi]RLL62848.1 hypothetical protein DYS74_16085 [Sinirhodobacter hankyongi]
MLIFWDQRLVFLATPKAGSTAVEAALEPLASVAMKRPDPLKHMAAQDYLANLAPYLEATSGERFTTVALMREPVGWLMSWYRFRQRDVLDGEDAAIRRHSFETFARSYMDPADPLRSEIGLQSDVLADAAGAPLVDRIFRYEAIDRFVHFLEDRLDCAITLPRVNVPPAADVKLTGESEAALRTTMAADVALYDSLG